MRDIAKRVALALALVVVVAFFALPALDAAGHADRVRSGVTLGHADVSGRSRSELERRVREYLQKLVARKLGVRVAAKRFEVEPDKLGVRVDVDRTLNAALAVGRTGGMFARTVDYWRRRSAPREIELSGTLDANLLAPVVETWELQALEDRPFAGGLEVHETSVKELPPHGGRRIALAAARPALVAATLAPEPYDVTLPLEAAPAPLPPDAAHRAAEEARSIVAAPLALSVTEPAFSLSLSPLELASVLGTERDGTSLRVVFVRERLEKLLETARTRVETEPADAKFDVSPTGAVTVVPSRPGTRIDFERLQSVLLDAAKSATRSAELPLAHRPEPALTTEHAEALGIRGMVSSFTTRHPCCEKRVSNIHRIADLLDGQVVLPGQTVSVNDVVGPRTLKRGFVPAPTIEEGEMVDSVGGGISQFATTLFNALFHGGYDIIERQPHSYWFPRYPMGHEATLSWPKPDIIFRNDTEAGLLIKTSYTDTSITVRLFGDNGGRKVRAEVSGRQNIVPAPLEFIPNPRIPPDEEHVKEPGSIGWSVIVSRILTFPDGTKKEERRRVTYKSRPRRIELHPCRIPEGERGYTGERCPVPENTEAAPTSESPSDGPR